MTRFATPAHGCHDQLEQVFWDSVTGPEPLYGADVADSLMDDDLQVWNLRRCCPLLCFFKLLFCFKIFLTVITL